MTRAGISSEPVAARLVHPPTTLIVGLLSFALFAGLAIVSNVFRNATTTWWTTAVFVGFAVMAGYVIIDYVRAGHDVQADGLSYRTLFRGRRLLRWSELRRVRYSPGMKWFRLETTDGAVARLSVMLKGLPQLARRLLDRAPAGAIDDATRRVLQQTAEGHPPSVWS